MTGGRPPSSAVFDAAWPGKTQAAVPVPKAPFGRQGRFALIFSGRLDCGENLMSTGWGEASVGHQKAKGLDTKTLDWWGWTTPMVCG